MSCFRAHPGYLEVLVCNVSTMSSLTRRTVAVIYTIGLVLLIDTLPHVFCAGWKTFHHKGVNGSDLEFSYPRSKIGDCVYDSARDLVTCMKNHPYDVIVSTWRNSPENVSYVSVNCLKQRMYASNHQQCICKNSGMAAHPNKRTQLDSYVFCQLDAVYRDMWDRLVNLEVIDLSYNHLFRVPRDCFHDMKKLKFLSLSGNQIKEFFDGLLCGLPKLEVLLLQDLPLISFPENLFKCLNESKSNVKVLDLRRSTISVVSPGNFRHLPRLGFLDLSYNDISEWPKQDIFAGLESLETLDLSGNPFSKLPWSLCKSVKNLKRVSFRDSHVVHFDCSVFDECDHLEVILMSSGSISVIENSTCQLTSLRVLDLSRNKLKNVPHKLFNDVSLTEVLDLSLNMIKSLHGESFHNLENLKNLNLSFNGLREIDGTFRNASKHLVNLEILDLQQNTIETIETKAFKHLRYLSRLDLSGNVMSVIKNETFFGLDNLNILNLSQNDLTELETGSFSWLSKLENVDLSHNNISSIDARLPISVQILNINHNKLQRIEGIGRLENLEELHLAGNQLTTLSRDIFRKMSKLHILDLSDNNLTFVDENSFTFLNLLDVLDLSENNLDLDLSEAGFKGLERLTQLDLNNNDINDINGMFDSGHFENLSGLDLSFNSISSITRPLNNQNKTVGLKSLSLQNNQITFITSNAFIHLDFLQHVNLQGNLLSSMPLFEARLGAVFFFKENPLVCSCDMVWVLKRWLDTETDEKISTYDYDVYVCLTYPTMTTHMVRKLSAENFMCPVVTKCPNSCQCYKLHQDGPIYMTVCRNKLTMIPKELPQISEILYLDGNSFHDVDVISSVAHTTKKLFLNSSSIEKFGASPFRNFPNVTHIDISNNNLRYLPETVFDDLNNIIEINIKNNLLHHLEKGLFDKVPTLQNIDVSSNKLHFIAPETLAELDNLDTFRWIRLSGNPLLCVCENAAFRKWLDRSYNRVYDRRHVLCGGEEIRRVEEDSFLCHDSFSTSMKMAVIIICVVAVFLPVIAILIYCRKEVTAICYARVVPLLSRKPVRHHHSDPYLYDAVILYDTTEPKCAWWIQKSLLPKLTEGRRKFKVYIPKPNTESADTTLFNIQKSRCTLALVTNTFHQNRFALDCFRHSATQEVNIDNDHHVIIITWGFIDKRNVPSYLKYFLDHRDILPVTASFFWDKLIQKLPNTLNRWRGTDTDHGETNHALQSEEHRF